MKTEKAMQLALLLGRLRQSYKKQIAIAEELSESSADFFLGWQCARQEEVLLRALHSLNEFLLQEGVPLLGEYPARGESLEEWAECLRLRLGAIEAAYRQMQTRAIGGEVLAEDLFPELEGI